MDRERIEGRGAPHELQKRADVELPALLADVRGGRWVDAVGRGNRALALGELTCQQQATVHRALLEAYVALDAVGLAAAECTAWRGAILRRSSTPAPSTSCPRRYVQLANELRVFPEPR